MKDEKVISYHTFMLPFTYEDKKDIVVDWKKEDYKMSYNEQAYFHDFFIDSITEASFFTRDFKNSEFVVKKSQEYKLELDNTGLRLFEDEKVGILTLNLKNKNYSDIKSVLEINDFTRRLYPEYLDYEKEKSGLVPEHIEFDGKTEKFEFDKDLKKPELSKIIGIFLPIDKICPAIDDRMFTISFYKNEYYSEVLKKNFTCNDDWYKYVFVDGDDMTVQNKGMQKDLIKKATYKRWQNYGTMYGISKYSFVCLSNSDFQLEHMKTMYFSMFSLLLMTRATILKFSKEVSKIAKDIDKKDVTDEVEKIYAKYIKFVNGFYFREITAKDQGLEIYEQAMSILNIERDIKDLDAEIEELHRFVEMKQEKETSKTINFLTYLGGFLLPPTIVTGFLGMNSIDFAKTEIYNFPNILVIVSAFIVPVYIKCFKEKK